MVKCLPAMWETRDRSLGWEDPLEKEMATHSSTLAWRIPWMEGPGRLQSMGSQRVGHDFTFTFTLSILMSYMSLLESKCASSHLCFSAFENQVEAGHLSRSEKFSREDLNYRVRALGVGSGLNMEIFNVLSARSKTPPNLLFFP